MKFDITTFPIVQLVEFRVNERWRNMQALILEGGSFRPVFSCGIMDALLEENVMFPYVIGVSAGIANGVSYVSRQPYRNIEIMRKYRNDKRYMGRRNFFKCRSIFGLDFVYDEIPNKLIPFDYETFRKYEGTCLVGVTNAQSGKAEFHNALACDTKFTMLRATCALPVFFPAIQMNENYYYDGGLCAPIPIEKAEEDGCDRFLIILTRPEGYVKSVGKYDKIGAKIVGHKYPKVKERILNRYKDYNKEVKRCEQLEREGKAIILRPEYSLKSFESDLEQLEKNYQHGYRMAKENMDKIKKITGL